MKTLCIYIALVFSASFLMQAQQKQLRKGDSLFAQYAFVEARQQYLKVLESGVESPILYGNLADAYYYTANYDQALVYYSLLESNYPKDIKPKQWVRYVNCLRTKNLDKKIAQLRQGNQLPEGVGRSIFGKVKKTFEEYVIKKLPVSMAGQSDFGPAYYGEKLLFSSTRDSGTYTHRIQLWNERPFLDFYTVQMGPDSTMASSSKLKGRLNTRFHESSAVLSPSGDTLYFTRNNYTPGNFSGKGKKINRLKLYRSVKDEEGQWAEAKELPFNSDNYSTAHPAISPDGRVLYLSSDREGGFGGSDLYKVDINKDGSYGDPENLGREINTPGRESFPFVSITGDLYFASDGRPGMGGLDIYMLKAGDSVIKTLGLPINSPQDDFGLIVDPKTKTGYFSSNRNNHPSDDDLYSFKVINNEDPEVRAMSDEKIGQDPENKSAGSDLEVSEGKGDDLKMDLGIKIDPIYFDYDSADLKPAAIKTLKKIVNLMQSNAALKLSISAHTDCFGTKSYNLALSRKRYRSTLAYIHDLGGISENRINGTACGSSAPQVSCAPDDDITHDQQAANRRCEFTLATKNKK